MEELLSTHREPSLESTHSAILIPFTVSFVLSWSGAKLAVKVMLSTLLGIRLNRFFHRVKFHVVLVIHTQIKLSPEFSAHSAPTSFKVDLFKRTCFMALAPWYHMYVQYTLCIEICVWLKIVYCLTSMDRGKSFLFTLIQKATTSPYLHMHSLTGITAAPPICSG